MSKNCKLHPQGVCGKKDDKGKAMAPKESATKCDECAPWQRYLIYAIPFLLYIPWAIKSMKCPPKCCPPATTCPSPPQPSQVCCPKPPKQRPKSEEPCPCPQEKKKDVGCEKSKPPQKKETEDGCN